MVVLARERGKEMRVAWFLLVVLGLGGVVGAALVDRWNVWPDPDWSPPSSGDQPPGWTGTMVVPLVVEPEMSPGELPPPPQ